MRPRTVLITLVQGALVAVLGVALVQAVETAPAYSKPRCADEYRRQAEWASYCYQVRTPTPCDPWADENTTPIPGSMMRQTSPCGVVASDATWAAIGATWTAGIIDGTYYGLHVSNGAPLWTPTIFAYGTVPPEVLAGYPATLTALPQETPVGWRLEGDQWVVDARRQP
jgi:hypothetical protein